MGSHKDVVVIGGGIVGTTMARELQARGRKVTLIERSGIASGCSKGNAGWLTPCFAMPLPQPGMFWKSLQWLMDPGSPLYIKPELEWGLVRWLWHFMLSMRHQKMLQSIGVLTELSKYSLDFYEQLAQRHPDRFQFQKRGLLMVSGTSEGVRKAKEELELMTPLGVQGRSMGRDELLAFEPALKSQIQGGVFFENEAHVEPKAMTESIHQEFTQLGGETLWGETFDFETQNGKITKLRTTLGDFSADLIVLAAGNWSAQVGRRLGLSIPLRGGKGYSMLVKDSPLKPQRPIMIVEKKIAVTPLAEGTRLAGTLELVGRDETISPHRVYAIQKGAEEFLNIGEVGSHSQQIWRGLRPCTPDGVPLVGYSKKWSNLFYNTGHQMLGLQSAPGTARLAADLIEGKPSLVDGKACSPLRYE